MARKIYCYADETGQDTQGAFFLVAIITVGDNRDELLAALEDVERRTGKGKRKWFKTRPEYRLAYMAEVFRLALLPVRFICFGDGLDYEQMTAIALSRELCRDENAGCRATVLIDGLQKSRNAGIGKALRQAGTNVRKVRGVRDESDALIRLADAVAGFARQAIYGREPKTLRLFEHGWRMGLVEELDP